ncbi:hypothetical protein T261_6050 [Streptomyces lydicus]|nr:hypothetical protein T261_6050 [Streptomyces lydicus]
MERRDGLLGKRRRPPLGRPSRSLWSARESVGRRMSGPPPVHVHGRLRVHAGHPTRCRARRTGVVSTGRLTLRSPCWAPGKTP